MTNKSSLVPVSACLPLKPDDIFVLRGQPMAKVVKAAKNILHEEFIYYQPETKTKESYLFKSGHFIKYKKESMV